MKKKSNLIICSIVRNASKGLKKNIPIIDLFLTHIDDYKIIIFENDSVDNTKLILKEWSEYHGKDKFHLFCENRKAGNTIPTKQEVNDVNPYFSSKRIHKMVDLRNQYLEYIDNHNFSADYLMVVDLDVAQLDLNGILSVFNTKFTWDAVCANGYSLSPYLKKRYHDSYALTEWGDENQPQTEQKILLLSSKYGNLKPNDDWTRVYSAFGGLSIYKFDAIKDLRYKLIYNNDSRVEVKCEHFSICNQMINNGYDRIYLVPSLVLKYQSIDINLFFKKIKDFFR